jgi:Glycosyl hydrolases family 28/Protein of unknown function (DUF1349)
MDFRFLLSRQLYSGRFKSPSNMKFRSTGLWALTVILGIWTKATPLSAQTVYNVRSYGAAGNGTTLDTSALQATINAAHSGGGGQVYFPPGIYKTTQLTLADNVTLNLTNGALLQASTNQSDWSKSGQLVYALSAHDVGVSGSGTVDGGGLAFYVGGPSANATTVSGNHLVHTLQFQNCSNVVLTGIHVQNSTEQTLVLDQCDNVTVDGVTVTNRAREYGSGTDGLDLNNCRYVTVNNMSIETGDDGICVKTQGDAYQNPPRRTAHDILIKNCTVASTCQATKIGTATYDEVYNLTLTNITINRHSRVVSPYNPIPTGECEAAINLEMCDGGNNHDIVCTHYTINRCYSPIYMVVENRSNGFGSESNVSLSDIVCTNSLATSQINVQPGGQFQSITLSNLSVHNFETYSGTGSPPYQDNGYPYGYQIGGTLVHMPAYGLFARYVDGLQLNGAISFFDDGQSGRPALVLENCGNATTNAGGGGTLTDVDIGTSPAAGSASLSGGTWTVSGSGADIWNSADNFHYAYYPVSGDVTLVARIVSVQNTAAAAKGGVMIRETLNANAANVILCLEPGKGIDMARRATSGGSTAKVANPAGSAPCWVKLVRSGNTFTGYSSADGVSWTTVGTTNISMAAAVTAGLAVTSTTAGLCSATFDHLNFPAGAPPPNPSIVSFGLDASSTHLVLRGTNGGPTRTFYVLRSPSAALPLTSWTPVATNTFGADGSFSATNELDVSQPQQFYILKMP